MALIAARTMYRGVQANAWRDAGRRETEAQILADVPAGSAIVEIGNEVDTFARAIGAGSGASRQILADAGSGQAGIRDAGIIRPALGAVVQWYLLATLRRL